MRGVRERRREGERVMESEREMLILSCSLCEQATYFFKNAQVKMTQRERERARE